jgi:anthranilate/para-aminobenzoate synthase component II
MGKLLFIDHFDSFSNNILSWFLHTGYDVHRVFSPSKEMQLLLNESLEVYDGAIFSPGPGHPSEYLQSLDLLKKFPLQKPFLGICLGHQILMHAFGGIVAKVDLNPLHGRRILFTLVEPSSYLPTLAKMGKVVTYHSLGTPSNDEIFRKEIKLVAEHSHTALIAEHRKAPWIGVQFHPESFASLHGIDVFAGFHALVQNSMKS